jgi:hypothetical protein
VSDDEAPAWRYLVPGLLMLGLAGYMLVTGELQIDKKRTMTITRAGDPAIYWTILAVSGTVGALALRKVWKRLFS